MPSSDSEDFESADEGQSNVEKHGRKKRQSSSNYSDSTLESDSNAKKHSTVPTVKKVESKPAAEEPTDGWDDFDIEDEPSEDKNNQHEDKSNNKKNKTEESATSQDTGWDDFGDWGQDEKSKPQKEQPQQTKSQTPEADVKLITEQMDRMGGGNEGWPTWSGGWGWGGWGVDSLLTSATAGISTLTSQVSQGISTALETGIGAPDPEQLARQTAAGEQNPRPEGTRANVNWNDEEARGTSEAFPFGSLLSGVTKFVESTGTKVIAGGLDTLETIGKKTMEVLQDGDPGLAKKRAMLGLDYGDKPVLSQLLREAKSKADEEDRVREEKREAKEVHYENLFDDFEGLVHLEALEMLSKQVQMRIEERLRGVDSDKRQDIKETLQQVAELCEMPEEEEEDEDIAEGSSKPDAFLERLQTATQDIGIKIQFQPLVKHYSEVLKWPSEELTEKAVYKRAVSGLAQATALSVELYHKTAEMLLVNTRRSTADEADALTQMTVVLTKHISDLANCYTEKLNAMQTENKEQLNTYITNIFLEAGNSSTYIQNAFQLALPILQIGAV